MATVNAGDDQNADFIKAVLEETAIDVAAAFEQQPEEPFRSPRR